MSDISCSKALSVNAMFKTLHLESNYLKIVRRVILSNAGKGEFIINTTSPTLDKVRVDNKNTREMIMKQSYTKAAKRGMSKGTLYYRNNKIAGRLPFKIYKTRTK